MVKGINQDCAMLWRTIAKKGGWWSVLRLTREWAPTFSLAEVEQHLVALFKGGFLVADFSHREGSIYAFTAACKPLPDQVIPVAMHATPPSTPGPRRPDVMGSVYVAPTPNYRDGALDFERCPSVHMGQRFAFRGISHV